MLTNGFEFLCRRLALGLEDCATLCLCLEPFPGFFNLLDGEGDCTLQGSDPPLWNESIASRMRSNQGEKK